MNTIKSINLEIIDICNLKCNICDIWKNKTKNFLNINDIINIFGSKNIDNKTDITITGGEPLLHNDIINLFKQINKLGFFVNTISTNGILFDKLELLINYCFENKIQIPNIHISIDGKEKNHDLQRGVKGSFKKSIETIIKLKKKFKDINIKLKYTITNQNIVDIKSIFLLSKKLNTDISFKIVENDIYYTNTKKSPKLLTNIEKLNIIKILKEMYGNNNLYIDNLIYYIENNKLNYTCTTNDDNIFIMANGDVHSCTKSPKLGNIKNNKIDEIFGNKIHEKIKKNVKKINCNNCFSLHGSYKNITKLGNI